MPCALSLCTRAQVSQHAKNQVLKVSPCGLFSARGIRLQDMSHTFSCFAPSCPCLMTSHLCVIPLCPSCSCLVPLFSAHVLHPCLMPSHPCLSPSCPSPAPSHPLCTYVYVSYPSLVLFHPCAHVSGPCAKVLYPFIFCTMIPKSYAFHLLHPQTSLSHFHLLCPCACVSSPHNQVLCHFTLCTLTQVLYPFILVSSHPSLAPFYPLHPHAKVLQVPFHSLYPCTHVSHHFTKGLHPFTLYTLMPKFCTLSLFVPLHPCLTPLYQRLAPFLLCTLVLKSCTLMPFASMSHALHEQVLCFFTLVP